MRRARQVIRAVRAPSEVELSALWRDDLKELDALARRLEGSSRATIRPFRGGKLPALLVSGADRQRRTTAAARIAWGLGGVLYRSAPPPPAGRYIGETEKNLVRMLAQASSPGVVLLFDEADALFGKRTTVRDSHDRYANLETGFLLQRLEGFRGLVILSANRRSQVDRTLRQRLAGTIHLTGRHGAN